MTSKLLTRTTIAVLASAAFLGGCAAPVVMGGAMLGTVLVASDRRTSGIQLEDEGIELRGGARVRELLDNKGNVNLVSYNRVVLLTGEVPSEADKQRVGEVVLRVENVKRIANELQVMGNSTLTQRSSDALVTGRVKAAYVDARDLFASAFKVTTDRGTTYLMGRVPQKSPATSAAFSAWCACLKSSAKKSLRASSRKIRKNRLCGP
jgi:osmotically-inducible protein OsmY